MTAPAPGESSRAMDKSPDAFRTISEVAEDLDVPQHVLRFWETRFSQIRPLKRGGGRRYYRPEDVDLLKGIRHLLYGQGYTIKGVQRILKEEGSRFVQAIGRGEQRVEAPGKAEAEPGLPPEPWQGDASMPSAPGPCPMGEARHGAGEGSGRGSGLAPKDRARLEAALAELEECRRVLATLKAPLAEMDAS